MKTYVPATVSRYAPKGDSTLMYVLSDEYKRLMWRSVWAALASAQSPALVPPMALDCIIKNSTTLDIQASLEEEKHTHHDLVAELNVYRRQCGVYGEYIHLGCTSSDITENAHIMQISQATKCVIYNLSQTWMALNKVRMAELNTLRVGMTHLQTANATSYGNLFGYYANELNAINSAIGRMVEDLRIKGFKGSVGNRMAFAAAYWLSSPSRSWEDAHREARFMEHQACYKLGMACHDFSLQTPNRHQEYTLMSHLCSAAACLSKIATDIRLLCSTGHVYQIRSAKHVGSSAMPWKNNPIEMENVCSLARMMPGYLSVIWENRASNWLERSLDDSANTRIVWPEALLTINHMSDNIRSYLETMTVSEERIDLDEHVITGQSLELLPASVIKRDISNTSFAEIEIQSAKSAFVLTKI